jgi:predicted nucleotidyltransferase
MELDYQRIFTELNKERIDYVVVGGLAVNFHGIPRMTYDIDLMIFLDTENIMKTVARLKSWGYFPRAPVKAKDLADREKRNSWVKEKNMKAFTFYNEKEPVGEIDLLIDSPIPYVELRKRAVMFDILDVKVPVISVPDLIELKLNTGRKQDLSDIEHLQSLV